MRLMCFAWIAVFAGGACTRTNPSYGDGEGEGSASEGATADDAAMEASASLDDAVTEASADGMDSDPAEDTFAETGGVRACCVAHPDRGCEEDAIEACVCGLEPRCCSEGWAEECVAKARRHCGAECGVVDDGWLDTGGETATTDPATSDESGSLSATSAEDDAGSSTGHVSLDCCDAHEYAGCENAQIEACVCEELGLELCCSETWDDSCVEAANACSSSDCPVAVEDDGAET